MSDFESFKDQEVFEITHITYDSTRGVWLVFTGADHVAHIDGDKASELRKMQSWVRNAAMRYNELAKDIQDRLEVLKAK